MSLTVIDRPIGHKSNALTPAEDYPIIQAFGSFGGPGLWVGGMTANNGSVYCPPFQHTSILKINPDRTTEFIGHYTGLNKWQRFTRAQNNCLYASPDRATTVLKIDPSNDSHTTFGSVAAGNFKYTGSILANNGKIYCIPYDATTVLKIDPDTDTISTFGAFAAPRSAGACLAPNGKIYCFPLVGSTVFIIDPSTDTITTATGQTAVNGAILTYNDKIITIPRGGDAYEFDHVTEQVTRLIKGTLIYSNYGAVLGPNKKIYCIPVLGSDPNVLEIDVRKFTARTILITGPFQSTSWAGGSLTHDGRILCPPLSSNRILEISRIGQITNEMYTFPDNISGLSGTAYNKHYNCF